jgi:hypothetical protein
VGTLLRFIGCPNIVSATVLGDIDFVAGRSVLLVVAVGK